MSAVNAQINNCPTLDFSKKLSKEEIWQTTITWISTRENEVIKGTARRMIARGFIAREDLLSEAFLVAYEALNKVTDMGRIDLFHRMFFSDWKYYLQDMIRNEFTIARRVNAGVADEELSKAYDTRTSPEECLEKGPGPKEIENRVCEALNLMTKSQAGLWKKVLSGWAIDRSCDNSRATQEQLLNRGLRRVAKAQSQGFFTCCLLGLILLMPTTEAQSADVTYQTKVDYTEGFIYSFTPDEHAFVVGKEPKSSNVWIQDATDSPGKKKPTVMELVPGGLSNSSVQVGAASGSAGNSMPIPVAKPAPAGQDIKPPSSPSMRGGGPKSANKSMAGTTPGKSSEGNCTEVAVFFPLASEHPFTWDGLDAATNGCRNEKLQVTGHTCDMGSDESNQDLSDRRAQNVAKYLRDQGANVGIVKGVGESPAPVGNPRSFNRRVDVAPASIK